MKQRLNIFFSHQTSACKYPISSSLSYVVLGYDFKNCCLSRLLEFHFFKKRFEINFGQGLKRISNSLWIGPKHISAILSYVFMSSGILTYNQNVIMKSKYWYILTNKKSSYVLQYQTVSQEFFVCLHFWNFKITCKVLDIVLAFSNKLCFSRLPPSPPPPPCSRFSSLYKNKASISFVCNLLLPSVNDEGYVHTKELF